MFLTRLFRIITSENFAETGQVFKSLPVYTDAEDCFMFCTYGRGLCFNKNVMFV